MRRFRSNPAVGVTNQIISRSLPWLKKYVNNQKLLPNIDDHLGCGSFGCVYGTDIPEIVVKVTADERQKWELNSSHIEVIQEILPHQPIPGLAFFYDVTMAPHALDTNWFFVWRERVERVGECPEDLIQLAVDVQDLTDAVTNHWRPNYGPLWRSAWVDLHRRYPHIAEGFAHCVELGWGLSDIGHKNIGWNGSEWVIFDPLFNKVNKQNATMLLKLIENA